MATHSSVLAWRIPGTGEPGGLPSVGLQSQTRLRRLSSSSRISLSSFTLIKRLFSSSSLSAVRGVSSAYLRLLIFLPEI